MCSHAHIFALLMQPHATIYVLHATIYVCNYIRMRMLLNNRWTLSAQICSCFSSKLHTHVITYAYVTNYRTGTQRGWSSDVGIEASPHGQPVAYTIAARGHILWNETQCTCMLSRYYTPTDVRNGLCYEWNTVRVHMPHSLYYPPHLDRPWKWPLRELVFLIKNLEKKVALLDWPYKSWHTVYHFVFLKKESVERADKVAMLFGMSQILCNVRRRVCEQYPSV